MSVEPISEILDLTADFSKGVFDQGISRHPQFCLAFQVAPDVLHLACGNSVHIDKSG